MKARGLGNSIIDEFCSFMQPIEARRMNENGIHNNKRSTIKFLFLENI
jgi:hypothetical protein